MARPNVSPLKWISLVLAILFAILAISACATPTAAPNPVPPASAPTVAAATAPVAPTAAPSKPNDKVTMRLSWKWKPEYATWALVVDKGFFAKQGIDVELLEGSSSNNAILSVGNKTDDFATTNLTTMTVSVGKGVPVKAIASLTNKTPMALLFYKEQNIKKPKDLEGHSIALTPGESFTVIWPFFAKQQNIDTTKVKVVQMDATARDRAWLDGTVDVTPVFVNNLPAVYLAKKPYDLMMVADWNFNVLAEGLIAHADTIKDKPDLVRRFVAGAVEGFAYARTHPEEAIEAMLKRSEVLREQPKDFILENYKRTAELVISPTEPNRPVGWAVEADWNHTIELLVESGGLPSRLPNSQFYTNEFVPLPK